MLTFAPAQVASAGLVAGAFPTPAPTLLHQYVVVPTPSSLRFTHGDSDTTAMMAMESTVVWVAVCLGLTVCFGIAAASSGNGGLLCARRVKPFEAWKTKAAKAADDVT